MRGEQETKWGEMRQGEKKMKRKEKIKALNMYVTDRGKERGGDEQSTLRDAPPDPGGTFLQSD